MSTKQRIWVCSIDRLKEGSYERVEVEYADEPSSVIVFRYQGDFLAYRNLCVHMPRRLDCEKDMIFDDTGQNLRCSMHGVIYDPVTGESISTICEGDKLTPIKVEVNEGEVYIFDKRVKPLLDDSEHINI